jgi:hypothetical protein
LDADICPSTDGHLERTGCATLIITGESTVGSAMAQVAAPEAGNEIIKPPPQGTGKIVCHQRLGGLLKS